MSASRIQLKTLLSLLVALTIASAFSACNVGPYVVRVEEAPEPAEVGEEGAEEDPVVPAEQVEIVEVQTEEGETTAEEVQELDEAGVELVEEAETGEEADEITVEEVDLAESLLRTSFLIGREIENVDGSDLGTVGDVIVDQESGRILYLTINYGGVLAIGERELAVPLSGFGWNRELELTLTTEEAALESVPALAEDWDDAIVEGWDAEVAAYWQEIGLLEEVDAGSVPVSAQRVIGTHAGNMGTMGGVVDDLLISLGSGEARYIAVFADPQFGRQDSELLMPFEALEVDFVGDELVYFVDIDPDRLEGAPLMNREVFLTVDIFDPSFVDQLDAFWSE